MYFKFFKLSKHKPMRKVFSVSQVLALCISTIIFSAQIAEAKKVKQKGGCTPVSMPASLVIDSKSGKVLHQENAKVQIHPASLTKLATLKIVFEEIESGRLSLNRKLYVSKNAEKMPPTRLGLKEGETISVRDAINAVIVKSANDASVVLAEGISGSEERFAKLMTQRARALGMHNTNFSNSSGLHHVNQKSTAFDLAKLSMALKTQHPAFYPLFAQNSFEFRGKTVHGHNRVVASYEGAEGLKTGFTCPSGFNLITTASRGNKALIGIVTGSSTRVHRDQKMVNLLDKHFGVVKIAPAPAKSKAKTIKVVNAKQKKKMIARS